MQAIAVCAVICVSMFSYCTKISAYCCITVIPHGHMRDGRDTNVWTKKKIE